MEDFETLPDDSVVSLKVPHPLVGRAIFKVSEFSGAGVSHIHSLYKNPGWEKQPSCEVLTPSNGWRKGKFRFRVVVEFCPEVEHD